MKIKENREGFVANPKANSYKWTILIFIILTTCFLFVGCSITRVIPIQLARVSQMESYKQTFTFLKPTLQEGTQDIDLLNRIQYQTRKMDDIFIRLLGPINWQNLKDLYGLRSIRDELISKKIYIRGLISLTFYLDPVDQQSFTLEGMGRYFLIREKTGAILLIGDFHITSERHSLAVLDRGYIITNIELFTSRVPEQTTYIHEAPLKYKIFMDTSMKDDGIYSLDYTKEHEAYLPRDLDEKLSIANLIGTLKIYETGKAMKLIDFRGLSFIRKDYEKKLKKRR